MRYRLVWGMDGDEYVDYQKEWDNLEAPLLIQQTMQGIFPALQVRIIEEPNEETGNCNEGQQERESVRQEGGQSATQEGRRERSAS
jgi:hypothetical protein